MNGRSPESVEFGPVLSEDAPFGAAESKGPFRFVPGDGLWRDGRAVALPPRALGVLTVLLDTPGTVVPKQAIMDAVWPETFVTDSSLLEAIGLVRDALGDDRRNPTYVQTVHRRGYRFIGHLKPVETPQPVAPVSGRTEMDRAEALRPILFACATYALTTICVAIVFALLGRSSTEPIVVTSNLASPGFAISHSGDVTYVPQSGAPIAPAWTSDGLELALAFSKAGPFTLMKRPGTSLLAGAGGQFPTSWSPDRNQLAYTEYQPITGADIWVFDVRTGARKPLARTWFDETWARFSPDGRWITYMSNESGRWEVYVRASSDTGRAVRVSAAGGAWPSWSNDGRTVFFSAADTTMGAVIRTVPSLSADAAVIVHQGGDRSPGRAELRVVLEWFSELTKRQS